MPAPWPPGFERVPDDDWVAKRAETLAQTYDTVQNHGWYRNLDPTIAQLAAHLRPGDLVLDYSGGTGILAQRLLSELPDPSVGILIVDASPKFLRVALEKLGGDERVAFRLIRYLQEERRLQTVQEVVAGALLERGFDAVASTNAIHLYYDLEDTLGSWREALRVGGRVFVQSGNIGVPDLPPGKWIIDETVEAINAAATELVRSEERYAEYRTALEDPARRAAYDDLRRKFFLPVRSLQHYRSALERAGFEVVRVEHVTIAADTQEWTEFLGAYHEGVLGWVGGSERIEGRAPTEQAVSDRLRLMRESVDRVFQGGSFEAVWTYIEAE
ncbi:MAG TPA: class I SAM-dependent methyltransferase [Gaiellaceae bacterium]|nr:class I SAM-dependent methyltransferase [Gaiellaceae bacterium]